jgi:hypothetical protein
MRKVIYYILITIIIAISFFHFSGLHYPYLNSDAAIHILMANDFSIPDNLYFWGQDRLGSLIPLLSFIIVKLTGLSAITAVTFIQYIILFIGFLCISQLIKKTEIKILLAVLWFIPPLVFIDFILIAQAFGIQLSLLAISILLFNKLQSISIKAYRYHFFIFTLSVTLILAVWVSDIAFFSSILIALMGLFSFLELQSEKKYIKIKRKNIFRESGFYHFMFWVLVGLAFITYSKNTATPDTRYSNNAFQNAKSFFQGISLTLEKISDVFTFKYELNIFLGIFFWIAIIIIIILIFNHKHSSKSNNKTRKWFWFFLIHGMITLLIVYTSKWVYTNGMSRRYFVLPYISFAIAILLYLDNRKIRQLYLYSIIVLLGLSSLISSTLPLYYPKKLNSRYEQIKAFDQLKEAGIISEYWNSYVSSVANPKNILATPHDSAYVRNPELAQAVLKQKKIYLIKDLWLEEFPEATEQFDHFLKKTGEPFQLGGATLCQYEISKFYMIFKPNDLKSKGGIMEMDPKSKFGNVFSATPDVKEQYIIFGPFTDLQAGNYAVKYYLSIDNKLIENKVAMVDVTSDWGKETHCSLTIRANSFNDINRYQEFEMGFSTKAPLHHVEFRVYYYGNAKLSFSHVEISQL